MTRLSCPRRGAAHRPQVELLEDRLAPNNLLGLADDLGLTTPLDPWSLFTDSRTAAVQQTVSGTTDRPVQSATSNLASRPPVPAATTAAIIPLTSPTSEADQLTVLVGLFEEEMRGQTGNPIIVPPLPRLYGQLAAKWWQEAFSIPVVNGHHPLIDGGAFGGQHHVLFLSGVGGGVTIDLTVRPWEALFFPVVNAECSVIEPPPFHGDNEAELRECANHHMDNTSGRFAVIDGRPVRNLDAFRFQSPLFVFGPLPANNILGAPEGATSPAVDAGYYLFLAPLITGRHTLHFGGTFDELGFSIDTTYSITVAP